MADDSTHKASPTQRNESPAGTSGLLIVSSIFFVAGLAGSVVWVRRARAGSLSSATRSVTTGSASKLSIHTSASSSSSNSPPNAPPSPPTSSSSLILPGRRPPSPPTLSPPSSPNTPPRLLLPSASPRPVPKTDDFALSPFRIFAAFSIATCFVGGFAGLGVVGARWAWGVDNVDDFGHSMRAFIANRLPRFSSQLHRDPSPADSIPPALLFPPSAASSKPDLDPIVPSSPLADLSDDDLENWTFEAAQTRMSEAFKQGGLGAWMQQAGKELEAERQILVRERTLRDGNRSVSPT